MKEIKISRRIEFDKTVGYYISDKWNTQNETYLPIAWAEYLYDSMRIEKVEKEIPKANHINTTGLSNLPLTVDNTNIKFRQGTKLIVVDKDGKELYSISL